MNTAKPAAVPASPRHRQSLWGLLVVLFKVRVVVLLLFAAVGGAFIATGGWPGVANLIVLLVTGGLAAAGASAINQALERDLDARMERTRDRPLAARALPRSRWVVSAGVLMILLPALSVLPSNPALTIFLLGGATIYLGVYTIWLKPRTPLNIIIGGAAGSAAVLTGSAAAGSWNEPGAVALALLVFLWTPTHFWSLAIAYRDDYARGGFPMLPVQTTPRAAAGWVLLHASATVVAALALGAHPAIGWPYLAPVAVGSAALLALGLRLIARPGKERALVLFHASNLYLALVISMICINTLIP